MNALKFLIDSWHADGRLRVWSLAVTLFGDAVVPRGGQISGRRLGSLMTHVGVEHGALRTALSRLGRDGWIDREKNGRNSIYRLSAAGRAETAAATPLIYAAPRDHTSQDWALVAGTKAPDGGIAAGNALWLVPGGKISPNSDQLCVRGALIKLPDSVRHRAVPETHVAALAALFADIDALREPPTEPLDAMAVRLLLIHRWRRIVLRYPDVPPMLFPDSLPRRDPRREVAAAYHRLLTASEAWLDGPEDALPAAAGALQKRFHS